MNKAAKTAWDLTVGFLSICGLVLILQISTTIYEHIHYDSQLEPPKNVVTIADFVIWKPDWTEISEIDFHGSKYYAIKGPFARPLPSAGSEYYFDHLGNYLDRNKDVGDFSFPRLFSHPEAKRKKISMEEILQAIASGK